MTEHKITLAAGATKVLHTAGMYCDRDIVVTADGGGKREGTAIPADAVVDRIYFNTENSYAETQAILSQLTYTDDAFGIPTNVIYANMNDNAEGDCIMAAKLDVGSKSQYLIFYVPSLSSGMIAIFGSPHGTEYDENGWIKPRFEYSTKETPHYIVVGSRFLELRKMGQPITEYNGIQIGAENEKIKNVLSITPF